MEQVRKLIWVAILVLLIAAGYFLTIRRSEIVPVNTITTSSTPSAKAEASVIFWNSLSSAKLLKKTAPIPYYNDPIEVFGIGKMSGGQYSGKFVALGVTKSVYDDFLANKNAMYMYEYFIVDENGNTVAWDESFMHDPDSRCYGSTGVQGCDQFYETKTALGFTDQNETPLNLLPKEFAQVKSITAVNTNTSFSTGYGDAITRANSAVDVTKVDETPSGFSIVRKIDTNVLGITVLPTNTYYMLLPFDVAVQIDPEPNFIDPNDVPKLTWSVGSTSVQSYRYGQYAFGWQDCYSNMANHQLTLALVQTGKTILGDPVYEVDAAKYPAVYQCLHEKTRRYDYDPNVKEGTYVDTVSYADFVVSHPMFFWKHPTGELIAFIRSDVVPAAEKAKPVIYLYPTKTENISVKVSPIGGLAKTDPDYGNGWNVNATPNGLITNLADGRNYPYLFWEGGGNGIVETPKQGFVVARNDVATILKTKLAELGLNGKEQSDFLDFWVPRLSKEPYYFITFISRNEIDRVAAMEIDPRPDTVIRVLMDYRPLSAPISVEPLKLEATSRRGFTVVEWGGIVRD